MRPIAACTFAACLSVACQDQVPSASRVEDLRVLAIRADPPELLIDPGAPFSTAPVRFQALVVDPRGLPARFDWSVCPVESDETCADFERRTAEAPAEFRPLLERVRAQSQTGTADAEARDAMRIDPFAVEVPAELFGYHVAASALGLGNGAWITAVLAVTAADETLLAQKRVVLNARDLRPFAAELEALFGWRPCALEDEPVPDRCLPLAPRTANRNPEITAMEIARGVLADSAFEPVRGPLAVAPGESIRVRPILPEGTAERYQAIESTLEGSRLVVAEKIEEPVVSWFTAAGRFDDELTAPQITKTLDTVYTAPKDAEPGAQTAIWAVVRDGRGGVGWSRIDIVIDGQPAP